VKQPGTAYCDENKHEACTLGDPIRHCQTTAA
jgi:hypothetical protein